MKNIRKNSLLILLAILLVGGSFVFAERRNKITKNVYDSKDQQSNIIATTDNDRPQDMDTDDDGSKDWEEVLVGTDPNNPNSKPSKEKVPTTSDITQKKSSTKLDPLDVVSRDFFARYMELRQIGAENDKASQEELAKKTAGNIVIGKPAEYNLNEILTTLDSDNESIRQYGIQVSSIFKKYAIQSRNEGIITIEANEKEDPEILKELDPIIESYKNILNALIKVKVPQTIATLHLDLLNSMNASLFVAKSFRNSQSNPIEGVQAIAYYQVAGMNLYNSINAIKSYFKYVGIYENIF